MKYDKIDLKVHSSLQRDIWEAAVMEYPSEENAVELFLTDCFNSYYELQVLMRDHDTLRRECFKLHDRLHELVSRLITDKEDM